MSKLEPLFYNQGGMDYHADQKNVLFIHGAGGEHSMWAWQSRYLAHHGVNVFSVDLPSHGQSEAFDEGSSYRIEDFAQSLLHFCDHHELQSIIPIGHSMGALIAIELSKLLGNRVIGLGLLGVSALMPINPKLLETAINEGEAAAALISNWGMGNKGKYGGILQTGQSLFGIATRLMGRQGQKILANDLSACADYTNAEAVIKSLSPSLPIEFILSDFDRMAPAKAAQPLIAAAGNPHISKITNAGHMMMIEQPIQTRKAMMHLISRT